MQRLDSINPVAIPPCRLQDSKPGGLCTRKMPRPLGEESIHAQGTLLTKRTRYATTSCLNETSSHLRRGSVGGKGMFLDQMQRVGLSVPEFLCVTTEMVEAVEQHPLDIHHLTLCIPGIADELEQETCLAEIKTHINALPGASRDKRTNWLAGLSQFIASHDFYELIKDSEAARTIRSLDMPLPPVIVRSSGVNEDNFGDAQAGKYLSEVQEDKDVLRTCLKVMASGYQPGVCTTLQPMALIIQRCIDCRFGGVAMSYQSLQDDTIRIEYTAGQPRGAVAGLSDTRAHRIDIGRGTDQPEFTPGQVASRFILRKNRDGGYTEVKTSSFASDSEEQRLSDDSVAQLRKAVITLEDLLLCPVDVEFAIDHQDRLFLLQVRPITRLSGGMDFAMPTPDETLATGEGISEGFCTGTLWSATNQSADTMPEGAIVVARHGEPWMLEPEYLGRAAGFVFAAGGSNDHVAITLRQAGKPCLLAEYPAVTTGHGQQATLACGRFNATPEAFIVEGDLSAQLTQHRTASLASDAVKLPEVQASRDDLLPPEGTFERVDTGFCWLTGQNDRLLAFFAPGGGLDCLSRPVSLSMSGQRSAILAAAQTSIIQLVQGTEALLSGYQAFLQLAGHEKRQIKPLMDELPELISRFWVLKQTITSMLDSVDSSLNTNTVHPESPGRFQQWMATCQQLQSCLQQLHPGEAHLVQSIHDLIFALHNRFVDALGTVALVSGQGRRFVRGKITCVDHIPLGAEGLLRSSGLASIEQGQVRATLINMVDALIVNLHLGEHIATIELLENASGGRGRILRLKYTDKFADAEGGLETGKLKRMWFLARLLKATGVNKDAGDTKVRLNPAAGEITVECSQMASRESMQDAFDIVTVLLRKIRDFDFRLQQYPIFAADQWDFHMLAHRLDSDGSTEADRFAFNHCLFVEFFLHDMKKNGYYRFLSSQYQQFIDRAQQLRTFDSSYQELLMGDKTDQNLCRELLHHLLFFNTDIAVSLLEQTYNLQNKYFVLKPSHSYSLEYYFHPDQPLSDNEESLQRALLTHGIELASQSVRNDKNAVLPLLKKKGTNLAHVSETLRGDKDVVMVSVCQSGLALCYASPELRDDDEVVMAAITSYPGALFYASQRIRSDKRVVQRALKVNVLSLSGASKTLLGDREFMLSSIEHDAFAYNYCASELTADQTFRDAAIRCNPEVKKYLKHPPASDRQGRSTIL